MRWLLAILMLPLIAAAQNPSVIWKDHLPYKNVKGIALSEELVYAHTDHGVFTVNRESKEIERINKVQGLHEALISDIAYDDKRDYLIIGYVTGNIDVLVDGSVRNVSGIKSSSIIGDKNIYEMVVEGDVAYICCGYGITKLNLNTFQIEETFILGANASNLRVHDVLIQRDTIYAATDEGLFYGDMKRNLLDVNQWKQDSFFLGHGTNLIASLNGTPWVNISNAAYNGDSAFARVNGSWQKIVQSTYRNSWSMQGYEDGVLMSHNNSFQLLDANGAIIKDFFGEGPTEVLMDGDNHFWLASGYAGLIEIDTAMVVTQYFVPNGPGTGNVMAMEHTAAGLWVVPGGRNGSWNNYWRIDGMFHYHEGEWQSINGIDFKQMDTCWDLVSVKADPSDPDRVFVGSWSRGLLEFDNNQLVTIHGPGNSTIQSRPEIFWIGVGGIDFDAAGNMWISNSYTSTPLQVRTKSGAWKSFNLGETVQQVTAVGDVLVDDEDYVWMLASKDGRVAVYDFNGTPLSESDDQWIGLDGLLGNGSVPGAYTASLHLDRAGVVWLGTNDGIAKCRNTSSLFAGSRDLDVIYHKYDPDQRMLAYETVNAIVSDKANLKWVATSNDGLYLLSGDCDQVLGHYTEENSPLFSNHVLSLSMNEETGELYVGTAKGIMSVSFISSPNVAELTEPKVYPNPATRDAMMIKEVPYGTRIKVIDMHGRVVAEDINYSDQTDYDLGQLLKPAVRNGVYFLKLTSATGETGMTQKLVILD